jgi:hypothetical protein
MSLNALLAIKTLLLAFISAALHAKASSYVLLS